MCVGVVCKDIRGRERERERERRKEKQKKKGKKCSQGASLQEGTCSFATFYFKRGLRSDQALFHHAVPY